MPKVKIKKRELQKGVKEEMEHTPSKKHSKKIAMVHLKEDPNYYSKLKQAGLADAYAWGGDMYNNSTLDIFNPVFNPNAMNGLNFKPNEHLSYGTTNVSGTENALYTPPNDNTIIPKTLPVGSDAFGSFQDVASTNPTMARDYNPAQPYAVETPSNVTNANQIFGESSGNDYLNYGLDKGYKYLPLGDNYGQYKDKVQKVFDINDPIKKQKLLDLFDLSNPINNDPDRRAWLQEIYNKNPNILDNPQEIMRLATDSMPGPVHSLLEQFVNTYEPEKPKLNLDPVDINFGDLELDIPGPVDQTGTPIGIETPEKTKPPTYWERYAPMAFNALAPLLRKDPELVTGRTISSGLLRPELVDEQAMRAGLDSGYQAGVGNLANVSGGSGAAQRAGLTGINQQANRMMSDAFMQANLANMQARQSANQFNTGNQATMAQLNQASLNAADFANTAIKNRREDENMSYFATAAEDLGNIGKERMFGDIAKNIYGYDKFGRYVVDPNTGNKVRVSNDSKIKT